MMTETATLIAQLGTALPMLGAKDLVESGADSLTQGAGVFALQFRIRGCKLGNKIRITLRWDDTYSIEFWHSKGTNVFQVGETLDRVYADGLHQAIEGMTGLRCSL